MLATHNRAWLQTPTDDLAPIKTKKWEKNLSLLSMGQVHLVFFFQIYDPISNKIFK